MNKLRRKAGIFFLGVWCGILYYLFIMNLESLVRFDFAGRSAAAHPLELIRSIIQSIR